MQCAEKMGMQCNACKSLFWLDVDSHALFNFVIGIFRAFLNLLSLHIFYASKIFFTSFFVFFLSIFRAFECRETAKMYKLFFFFLEKKTEIEWKKQVEWKNNRPLVHMHIELEKGAQLHTNTAAEHVWMIKNLYVKVKFLLLSFACYIVISPLRFGAKCAVAAKDHKCTYANVLCLLCAVLDFAYIECKFSMRLTVSCVFAIRSE